MGDYLRKVSAGQTLEIPAKAYNAFIDSVHAVRQMNRLGPAGGVRGALAPGPVYVRNDTGADVDVHAVLGIGGVVYEPDNADADAQVSIAFRTQVVVKGVTPQAEHVGKFVVVAEPIADGQVGRAFAGGVCVVQITGSAGDVRQFADVDPASTAALALATTGAAQVLWSERDLGVTTFPQWAVVRINSFSTNFVRGTITDVSGFDGDSAGTVTYSAASDDGAVVLTDVSPLFRAYGPEVPVSIALIGDVCVIDPAGPTLLFTTEKLLTETCNGEAAYAYVGSDSGLNPEYLVLDRDGVPVVDRHGNLVVDYRANSQQTAAWALVVVDRDGGIVFDPAGNAVIGRQSTNLVHPDAFDLLVASDDDEVVIDRDGVNVIWSPLVAVATAEASPTSIESVVAQAMSAGSPSAVYLEASGGVALAGNWDAGNFEIRSATFESDVATGTAPLTIASTTLVSNLNADLLDGYHASSFGLATVATAFPTSSLVSGRSTCYRTDLCERFTYLSASDSPTGAAIWIGETFAVGFGTTAVTSSAGSQAFINEGNVLSDLVDRGKAFSFDCLVTSVEANNGDATAVSGTLTIYKNSSSLTTQSWSSNVQKGSTPLVKLTAGEVLGCDFNLSSGTLARMTVTLRLARIIAA